MALKPCREHFKAYKLLGEEKFVALEPLLRQKVEVEVTKAMSSDEAMVIQANLSRDELSFLSRSMPLVQSPADLPNLGAVLRQSEFSFCSLFSPSMIDACCQRGIFPMALEVKRGVFVFAPKLHVNRAVVRLREGDAIPGFPALEDEKGVGVFVPEACGVKRRLINKIRVSVNQLEDTVPAMQLIHLQHGENWLCSPLRMCFTYLLTHPSAFQTKFVLFVLRSKEGDTATGSAGPIVAAELGFIVADVYTSATGAYCSSSCGSLQLAAIGLWLRGIGIRVWDLGMMMDYKEKFLRCITLPRKRWCSLIESRRSVQPECVNVLSEGAHLRFDLAVLFRGVKRESCETTCEPRPSSGTDNRDALRAC